MTSRELTSGFKFWSRGDIRMVAMHLPIKFGADIFIWSRVIGIFPKLKIAAAAILDLLGEPTRPKFSVFWEFYPQNLGEHRSDPQKAHLSVISVHFTSFELSSVKIHPRV